MWGTGVLSFAINGLDVDYLAGDGTLWGWSPTSGWGKWGTGVQSFAINGLDVNYLAGDGTLWGWNPTSGWGKWGTGVRSFASNGIDMNYLAGDGTLWGWNPTSGWGKWGAGVQSFAIADGTLYKLGTAATGGWLQKLAPGSSTWVNVAPSTVRFASAPDGKIWYLTTDNNLHAITTANGQPILIDGNVLGFTLSTDGDVFAMGLDGNLWKENVGWQQQGRKLRAALLSPSSADLLQRLAEGSIAGTADPGGASTGAVNPDDSASLPKILANLGDTMVQWAKQHYKEAVGAGLGIVIITLIICL
jgi:hypothetical protein